jgi:hypothetical protein
MAAGVRLRATPLLLRPPQRTEVVVRTRYVAVATLASVPKMQSADMASFPAL